MPKVSINILTCNRASALRRALLSVEVQSYKDCEVIVVNDGSRDETEKVLEDFKISRLKDCKIINHRTSLGISKSRQEALMASQGEYIAILDDDDEWMDEGKLSKQVKYLDEHPDCVLVGGAIRISNFQFPRPTSLRRSRCGRAISKQILNPKSQISNTPLIPLLTKGGIGGVRMRPQDGQQIRRTMLFRNNFFTSTVMFRREAAIKAGGFVKDEIDLGEDYDLWLRLGKLGKMHNFRDIFANYCQPNYNKEKFKAFLQKQLKLIKQHKNDYPGYFEASTLLHLRLWFLNLKS